MKRRIEFIVAPGQGGAALLACLAGRFTYHSSEEWAAHIREGRIRVNDRAASGDHLLAAGDRVEYIAVDRPEPPVSFEARLIFEDHDIMVVNKPGNLPCHPAGRYFNHTLWAWLKQHQGLESPALINRLDRETSGLLLVARHARAEAGCRAQFLKRSVVKRYVALVEGDFPEQATARGWMMPDPGSGVHKRRRFEMDATGRDGLIPVRPGLEWAETDFRRVHNARGMSLVEAVLHTGRMHQIRATLQALGFPVVGDKMYGPDPLIFVRFCTDAMTEEDWRRLRLPRQALHSLELEFVHPTTRQPLRFEAPMPEDMRRLLES